MSTLCEELAKQEINFKDIPPAVVHEGKRLILDSIGCALAGISSDQGKAAIMLARRLGGPPESSIIGIGDKVSCTSAAFANNTPISILYQGVLPFLIADLAHLTLLVAFPEISLFLVRMMH